MRSGRWWMVEQRWGRGGAEVGMPVGSLRFHWGLRQLSGSKFDLSNCLDLFPVCVHGDGPASMNKSFSPTVTSHVQMFFFFPHKYLIFTASLL